MTTLTRAGLTETGAMKKSSVHINIGCVVWCAGNITPAGTLYCDGSAVSRTTYAELFFAIGTTYGAGDGSTTFNLPDLRGQFVRGTGGSAAELGVEQNDAIRNIEGIIVAYAAWGTGGVLNPVLDSDYTSNAFERTDSGNNRRAIINETGEPATDYGVRFNASRAVPTAAENRPTNYAMRPCIIFE